MRFQGAVIREQGLTFAVVVVKTISPTILYGVRKYDLGLARNSLVFR